MKNAVFWDITSQFIFAANTLRLRYRAQPVRLEVFTAVAMKDAVFWCIRTQETH
jgi:hypothetical protein